MKKFTIKTFLKNDFFLCNYNQNFWGKQQNYLILTFCKNSNAVIIDWKKTFLNFKKVLNIIYCIGKKNGIMLSCLKYHLNLQKEIDEKFIINNCFVIFINKYYSFLNGFNFFINNFGKIHKNKQTTNYNALRLPSLVLMAKDSWKEYNHFFSIFIKYKILSIKCGSFLQNDMFIFYNLMLENSNKIYFISKNIYSLLNLQRKKW